MQNQVNLTGRLGDKAECRNIGKDNRVANLSIATDEGYRDSKGTWVNKTTWHRVTVFGKPAVDYIERTYGKGDLISFTGKLGYSNTEKNGQKFFNVELIGETRLLVQAEANRSEKSQERKATAPAPQNFDLDDEIPF